MKNVLVIGSTGQIGSELTMKLRNMIPDGNIVAGYIPGAEPKGILLESGPAAEANVKNVSLTNFDVIAQVAADEGYIRAEDVKKLIKFRNNPSDESWMGGK